MIGFAALPIYLATRVGWPNGGVPALSKPDFGVLLGHDYVIWYCICGILLYSKHLSQFCLVEFLTALLVLYHYDNYLTTNINDCWEYIIELELELLVYPHSPFTRFYLFYLYLSSSPRLRTISSRRRGSSFWLRGRL